MSACKASWFLSVTCGTPMGSVHGEIGKFRVLEPSVGLLGEHSHHGGRLKIRPLGWGLPWPPSGSQAPRGQLDAQPLPCPRCGGRSCAPGAGPTSLMPHSGQPPKHRGAVAEQSSLRFSTLFLSTSQTLSGGALRSTPASSPREGPAGLREAPAVGRGPHGAISAGADASAAAQCAPAASGPWTTAAHGPTACSAQETPTAAALASVARLDRPALPAWLHWGHYGDWRGWASGEDGHVGERPAPGRGWPDGAGAHPQCRRLRGSTR